MILPTALWIGLHLGGVIEEKSFRQQRQMMQRVFRGYGQKLLVGEQRLFIVADQRPDRGKVNGVQRERRQKQT